MAEIEFRSLDELYNRIKPALYSKVKELKRHNINFVKEEDIWNYLSKRKWKGSRSLSLNDMVSMIMDLDDNEIKEYVLDILRENERDVLKEEEGDLLWKKTNCIKEFLYVLL